MKIDELIEALAEHGIVATQEEIKTQLGDVSTIERSDIQTIAELWQPVTPNRGSGRKAGKLAKPKKDELAVAESRSVAPAQRPGLVDLTPIEPIKVRRTRSMPVESLIAHQAEDQAEQMQALRDGMLVTRQRAEQTAKIATVLNEYSLNLSLQLHNLPTHGTYEERLDRWEQYLDDRAEQERQAQETIEQLGAEIAQMANAAGIAL